jgi:hypothetical protein
MAELQIVRPGPTVHVPSSFEEERREVLESVMGALSSPAPDPDEMTACNYLLKHLAAIVGNRAA